MESPVRICLGAALVVNLLVLSTTVSGNALPQTTPEPVRDDRITRHNRPNATTWSKTKTNTPDVSINELSPKDSTSEEHTEKNAKYKDRGRVRFLSQLKSSTESSLRRVRSSTEADNVIIVTPTPEVKKPVEIIDSMKLYKKTKMPMSISSTTPMAVKKEVQSVEEYDDEEEEQGNESFERFTSSKFHDNSFFTIPSFDDDSFSNKVKQDYSSPSFGLSSFFPKESSYGYNSKDNDHFKSESFFDFDSDLTTPKNDFFDKKYQKISGSIIKKLESIKAMSPPPNVSNVHKIVTENVGLEMLGNNTPSNKSSVFIKNTKEIRLSDNEEAGTSQRQLSDVQGTSIYYEMSVLSTETYINHTNDDDCDESSPLEPTASTSSDEELPIVKTTQPTIVEIPRKVTTSGLTHTKHNLSQKLSKPVYEITTKAPMMDDKTTRNPRLPSITTIKDPIVAQLSTKASNLVHVSTEPSTVIPITTQPTVPEVKVENITTSSTNFFPISSVIPLYHTVIPVSTQNIISSTERVTKVFLNSYSRNRNYSKRLNLTGVKDSPNSVTAKPEFSTLRPLTRKFYYTTPRTRPIWMLPKRNVTKVDYPRPTSHTIYSEHFNIKDKMTTTYKPRQPSKTMLTTVSSEIDPVLQSDISGTKKVVHSQSITDNSIPSLWKRGSTKFKSSAATSTEVTDLNEMEIPPTSIAWALASMRNPPPLPSSVNVTRSTPKSVDENELQKVGEVSDKKESTTVSTTTTTAGTTSEDIIPKNITDVDQNKLAWQPVYTPTSPGPSDESTSEGKSEKLGAESNISVQSSVEPVTTESLNKSKVFTPAWIPAAIDAEQTNKSETIPPVDATKSTGFESITKLPSDVTTPQDEMLSTSEEDSASEEKIKTTTDYEITTIRFSYVPVESEEVTDDVSNETETTTNSEWHPIIPTRTKITTLNDGPITTYRPKYMTTTDRVEDITTISDTTPPAIEVSSQILEKATEKESTTTESIEQTTIIEAVTTAATTETIVPSTTVEITTQTVTEVTTQPTTIEVITPVMTTSPTTSTTTTSTTTTTTPPPTTTLPTTTEEDTTTIVFEIVTEINTEREKRITTTQKPTTEAELYSEVTTDCSSEENSDSNEIINQDKTTSEQSTEIQTTEKEKEVPMTTERAVTTQHTIVTTEATSQETTAPDFTSKEEEVTPETTTQALEETTQYKPVVTSPRAEITSRKTVVSVVTTVSKQDTTTHSAKILSTTDADIDFTTKPVDFDDTMTYGGEVTTEASSRVLTEESSTGAAVAIAVSTIGVIALVLLIGLLLVVRRRGRRGIYAQRCTPVSLDAYSLDSVSIGHRKGNHRLRASKRSYGNPAYDDEVTSHPMQYPALANFALDIESMSAEFAEIPSVTVRPEEVPPGCEDKNRYSNVLPLPETRVPLTRIGNDPTTEYINANYITGPGNIRNYYIACQAPLSNTVIDFWRMIWEQNSRLIVMLTEYMENGVEKCYEYLPPSEISDNKRIFGEFKIILKKREQRDKYAISSVQLINLATRTWREVTHLWYFWPAKGVPDDYDSILDFLSEMRSYMKVSQTAKEFDEEGVEVIYGDQNRSSFNNLAKLRSDDNSSGNGVNVYSPSKAEEMMRRGPANNGTLGRMKAASEIEGVRPCVVTCASGAGRSAVVIALDVCARALAAGGADVPRAVRHLRAQRPHSLSNRHHYILLYKVLSEYGNKLIGGVDTI